ncbi:MAG: hypothetical protein BA874_11915 [Desulfuromonadales bacterium C00003068]|jgi:putative Mg2+ transporter-C (MgtC) family protein|nr:MAG: hypothetical protein BA874_11915 [Desulfuromonadales bacterium C00003068]
MTIQSILSVDPFSWSSIGAALFCGTIVGFERQVRGKPVGIRTSSLIVLGTYMFILIGTVVNNDAGDPARIIGQVVTGIGFLGAGVMLTRDGVVVGVTSAATIWSLAAIGVCIAVVGELVAIKMAIVIIGILYGVGVLESRSLLFTRGAHAQYRERKKRLAKKNNLDD